MEHKTINKRLATNEEGIFYKSVINNKNKVEWPQKYRHFYIQIIPLFYLTLSLYFFSNSFGLIEPK